VLCLPATVSTNTLLFPPPNIVDAKSVARTCSCVVHVQVGEKALASQLLLEGEPLDPAPPLTLMLHKPVGYVVTSPEDEMVTDLKVYDLLPYRCATRCARRCITHCQCACCHVCLLD
jgi:16S rRNA U516 pseudouridylate synthase RsuA-like enzyme